MRYQYRIYAKLTEASGTGIEKNTELTGVGYRCRKYTDLTEVSGTGIEAVQNNPPYPRYCGRGYTGTRFDFIPTVPNFRVPVSSSYRTLRECSVGYCGPTEHSAKVRWGMYQENTPGIVWHVPYRTYPSNHVFMSRLVIFSKR